MVHPEAPSTPPWCRGRAPPLGAGAAGEASPSLEFDEEEEEEEEFESIAEIRLMQEVPQGGDGVAEG